MHVESPLRHITFFHQWSIRFFPFLVIISLTARFPGGGNVYKMKSVFRFFLQNVIRKIFCSFCKITQRGTTTDTLKNFCSVLTDLDISKQILMQVSITKFHENSSGGSRKHKRQMCPPSARPLKYSRAIPRVFHLPVLMLDQ